MPESISVDASGWSPAEIVRALKELSAGDQALLYGVLAGILLVALIRAWRCNRG